MSLQRLSGLERRLQEAVRECLDAHEYHYESPDNAAEDIRDIVEDALTQWRESLTELRV